MKTINIKKSKIFIRDGLIDDCGKYVSKFMLPCKILIISDVNVSKLYIKRVKISFMRFNFRVSTFIIKPGESFKSLKTINEIYDFLSANFVSRSDIIVGLGGGVITDISGFVAATYNRGVNLINIPTTLLAQVDAAIGGKNGINLKDGKNLVGTFYQPNMIFIDPTTLNTLNKDEWKSGIAEIIKYGCIKDKELFEMLENQDIYDIISNEIINKVIYKSVKDKKFFIEKDEFDLSIRKMLNFGHTIGHALEKLCNYETLSHGEAISIGMNIITKISEKMSLTERGTAKRICLLCKKYYLPTDYDISFDKILEVILRDKKIFNDEINFILLERIGDSFIYKIPCKDIINFFKL